MRARFLILAALGTVFALGAVSPAHADRDGWRRHEWRDRGGHDRGWNRHHHHWRPRYYAPHYAPPVVVAPPPAYRYYAPLPPPVYYGNPGVTFGFTFR